jgi:endonuclease YncB( thermonuclease family)
MSKPFELNGFKARCFVDSVYDGDTITIKIPIKLTVCEFITKDKISSPADNQKTEVFSMKIRLLGINSPEIRPPKTIPDRKEVIRRAKQAKEYLSSLVLQKIVTVEFCGIEKYGRHLATLYLDNGTCVNEIMISSEHAVEYML